MSKLCNHLFLTADFRVAYKAVDNRVIRAFGFAGSRNFIFFFRFFGMTEFVNISINHVVSANGASMGCVSLCCAGWSNGDISVCMNSRCGNFFRFKNGVANGTFGVFFSALNAICIIVNNPAGFGVRKLFECSCLYISANGASFLFFTLGGAGCGFYGFPFAVAVAESGDFFLFKKDFSANGAMASH